MNRPTTFLMHLLAVSLTFGQHVPTDERGDPDFRRQTDIDGNKVRTSVFNFGVTGRTGANPGEIPYEWPINTGKHYIAMTSIFIGTELAVADTDLVKPLVTAPGGRLDKDGNSMQFEPVPGYLNPGSRRIAKSDEPETWPESWPDKSGDEGDPGWAGSWNGYFGKDQFNADQEIYFKISDDKNHLMGYNYYPDTTDLTRQGAGILAGIRVMEWSQVLIEDVVFILYEVKNDGTKDLDKVSFSLWLADLVGGDADADDDAPSFDLVYDIAWSRDEDGRSSDAAFGTDKVGVAATAYLETPGNSVDRIDNDGDGELSDKKVTQEMVDTETSIKNAKDDNGNGLIDENNAHVKTNGRGGVTYANRMDDNGNGEPGSPMVTAQMIAEASTDRTDPTIYDGIHNWNRWPAMPERDDVQQGAIHLIMVEEGDEGKAFADGIDNNESEEYPAGLGADLYGPRITWAIIDTASGDRYRRYRVPGTTVILYDVDSTDFDLRYADGIDNDGDGAVDEGIDELIDEMIDESRDDFIDNDYDWNPLLDDVGYDGNGNSHDPGQNDGRPTSGALSNFPGEPNIDKTDVAESDQMGLTSVTYDAAGGIPTNSDISLWNRYMLPGQFAIPTADEIIDDIDLFVTSAFFPIKAGETKRISMAVCLGMDTLAAIYSKQVAQKTYDEDYQFAKQPIPPHVEAVVGDRKVTLIWDDIAESSFDSYMYGIGSEGYDFEGYKIFKATDPGFADALNITDAQGNLTFSTPIAHWDLVDGIEGYHEVAVNGVQYDLGSDTGLKHSFVDHDVVNGQTYYYAVVSYDFGGDIINEIPPTESNKRLVINSLTGEIRKGTNVVVVTPNPPAAGYVEADIDTVALTRGTTSAYITYEIVDHFAVKDNHTYQITFEDTLIRASGIEQDTLTTKFYRLVDITDSYSPDTLVKANRNMDIVDEQPILDGFRLTFYNEEYVHPNLKTTHWSTDRVDPDSLWRFVLAAYNDARGTGIAMPADYRLEIGTGVQDTSIEYERDFGVFKRVLPAVETNFTVKRRYSNSGIDSVDWRSIPFALENLIGEPGALEANIVDNDMVIFLDDSSSGVPGATWTFQLKFPKWDDTTRYVHMPTAGDTVHIFMVKPFLMTDEFTFITRATHIDEETAESELENITVVPNPYKVAVAWEPRNPYTTGRGPRALHFRHLPSRCTIRIFTVSGELVKVIEHQDPISDGTAIWDLLTKDNLDVSYGIYIYHVEAPGIGEHIGKFAIIK